MSDEPTIEQKARSEGWVPQEEFRGPQENWVDAETFVKRGQELAPILAAKNRKLMADIEELQAQMKDIRAASEQFRQVANDSIERSRRERDAAIAKLEEQKANAITAGDGAAAVDAERKIRALQDEGEKQKPQQMPVQQDDWNKQSVEWAKQNQWYVANTPEYNEEKRIYADGISDIIAQQMPHLKNDPAGYFKELSSRVEERFSTINPARQTQAVEGGGTRSKSDSQSKTFDNLPEAAKAGFEQMKFLMPGLTKEEYLRNYSWEK